MRMWESFRTGSKTGLRSLALYVNNSLVGFVLLNSEVIEGVSTKQMPGLGRKVYVETYCVRSAQQVGVSRKADDDMFALLIYAQSETALLSGGVIKTQVVAQTEKAQVESWILDLPRERKPNRQCDRISWSNCPTIGRG